MKEIAICGHFGFGLKQLDGQTVKTAIVADELERELGKGMIWRIDTHGRRNQVLMFVKLIWAMIKCNSIIIMPAQNALLYEVPWLHFWDKLFRRKLFYVVIGGWLARYLDEHPNIERMLKAFNKIYVETFTMKLALEKKMFSNISVLPNCKPLRITREEELCYTQTEPYRLVTFSRVMKEKGIEELVSIVKEINDDHQKSLYALDIYGQIDDEQKGWFDALMKSVNDDRISYCGKVAFDRSTEVLSNYFALVFPTKYYTEGIPGTIIDAYAAGLPVISAKWESFSDVVDEGVTGVGFEINNWPELKQLLLQIHKQPSVIYEKKHACIRKAREFLPEKVIPHLSHDILNSI